MESPNRLELAVLQKLLEGQHPKLVTARKQLDGLMVRQRTYTGVGFFTKLQTASYVYRLPGIDKIKFGDVQAQIDGLKNGAGFLLYIVDGLVDMLEAYSYEEPWPTTIGTFSLRYSDPSRKSVMSELDGLADRGS